jgi:hypothetical protein
MATQIITTDDFREFKVELFRELKRMLEEHHNQPTKRWLRSYQIRNLLGIAPGTLQNLRVTGKLPFTKIGGVMFYDYEEVRRMLEPTPSKNLTNFNNLR